MVLLAQILIISHLNRTLPEFTWKRTKHGKCKPTHKGDGEKKGKIDKW